jgi:hypothetical protein
VTYPSLEGRDLKVTHQKNQPHPSLEKNELQPKKINK